MPAVSQRQLTPDQKGMRPGQALHDLLLTRVRACVDLAKRHVSTRHAHFSQIEALRLSYADPAEVNDEGQLTNLHARKVVVPFTGPAIQSQICYWFGTFTGRDHLIPLQASNPAHDKAAQAAEAVLDKKLMLDGMEPKLWQWITDAAWFGQGQMHPLWKTEHQEVVEHYRQPLLDFLGRPIGETQFDKRVWRVRREGPVNSALDPYLYLPDPRVSSVDPQKGEFVAFQDWVSWTKLVSQQEDQGYFNLHHMPPRQTTSISERRTSSPREYEFSSDFVDADDQGYVTLSVVYLWLIPARTKAGNFALGDSSHPEIWQVVVANGSTIIGCKPYPGRLFPIAVMDTNFDAHRQYNPGDPAMCWALQKAADWYFNARAANLRAGLYNALAYDASAVDEEDVYNVEPALRIPVRADGRPLSEKIQQLRWVDTTTPFSGATGELGELIKLQTGAVDIFQGKHEPGATTLGENSMLMAQAQGRVGMRGRVMWQQGLKPWGEMLVTDLQEHMTTEGFYRIVGDAARDWEDLQAGRARITPDMIQGELEIAPADLTMPAQRERWAALWKELAMDVAKSQTLSREFDLGEMVEEIARLAGLADVKRFRRKPQAALQEIAGQGGGLPRPPVQTQVLPDEEVQRRAQAGDLVPLTGDGGPEAALLARMARMAGGAR